MDDDGRRYEVTIMGNAASTGENNNTDKGQLEPLTETVVHHENDTSQNTGRKEENVPEPDVSDKEEKEVEIDNHNDNLKLKAEADTSSKNEDPPTHVNNADKITADNQKCVAEINENGVNQTEEIDRTVNDNGEKELADDNVSEVAKTNGADNNNTNGTSKLNVANDDNDDDTTVYVVKKDAEDVEISVAGKDDVDAASTYSLFMEKDFRYYFQHPWCRIVFTYFVVFCNFLIYAEDPVAHSIKECYIPLMGNDIAFMMTRYPSNAWSLFKVLLWLAGLLVGMIIGKLIIHRLLFCKIFRIKMFSDDQGSWMMMFLCSLISVFVFSWVYNLFLLAGGDDMEPYRISHLMGVSNNFFMKVAACGTWCGDFFTAWMVTDMMLQEKLYPGWARPVRIWWKKGWHRIILFWVVTSVTSVFVIVIISTDFIQWDKLNRDFMPTNEVSRAFLASFILVIDMLIVMQDWDFPHFVSSIDIKLPGLNTAHIQFQVPIPKFLKNENLQVHITGKWFNYGVLFLVMLLDLNMWKNQIFYVPYDYGQYTGPGNKIYTIQDQYSLDTFNKSQLTYEFRNSTINSNTNKTFLSTDTHMNTRYNYSSLGVKAIAFIPCISAFITFGVLVFMFGRYKPTEKDPYAGRLKKRRKKLSFRTLRSLRMPWRRKQEVTRKVHAVPMLLYFKKKKSKRDPTRQPVESHESEHDEAVTSIEVNNEPENVQVIQ